MTLLPSAVIKINLKVDVDKETLVRGEWWGVVGNSGNIVSFLFLAFTGSILEISM